MGNWIMNFLREQGILLVMGLLGFRMLGRLRKK